ncbi:MAG: hypothetical protein KKE79_06565, partial [Actinobacteria bacterium]|nr:hypothetical protein [Actinomycetota bacterium]
MRAGGPPPDQGSAPAAGGKMWIAIGLLGGLAIFMFSMSLMSEGFQILAGGRLQRTLEALTRNRWVGAGVGTGVTA